MVSSDRELNEYAARCKITSLESSLFNKLLQEEHVPPVQAVSRYGSVQKREGHESAEDVDRLMLEASEKLLYKDEDVVEKISYKDRGKRASKQERQARKIAKKL